MNRILYSIIIVAFLFGTSASSGQVRLPHLISDGMVLQRETPVKIWGWATAGEKVRLSFDNKSFDAVTSADGKWLITLPAREAGGPFEIKITGKNEIILKDILFGDVWLCSGQSNMELPMRRVAVLYGDDIASSANPKIRQFLVPVKWNYLNPQQDIHGGKWEEANPQNVLTFSAVGYFFARDLYARYKVPVGIILCAAGGSCAEAWLSESSLKTFPEQYKIAKQLSDTTYLKNLLYSEQTALGNWFGELGRNDNGRKFTPWFEETIDDSKWHDFKLPSSFAEAGMDFRNGVVWFRKEIDLPKSCSGKQAILEFGRIVDSDSAFINGKFVGTTSYQYPPRRYNIAPGILKAGKNNITVRVVSQTDNGAVIRDKPYQLDVDGLIFDLKGNWKYKIGAKCGPAPMSTYFPGQPLGLYNAMLSPIVNYTLKGMVWYQGEANTERASEYKTVLSTLIGEWRTVWKQGNLPFLFVQLPDFMEPKTYPSESAWAALRFQQLKTLSVPNTAMAVTIGLGEWNDIHPLRKNEVGKRLVLAAEKLAYGDENVVSSGPIYQSMKRTGTKIELTFANGGSGLTTNDGKELKYFSIAGADKKFFWARAEIKGNKIVVWSEKVVNPEVVRYAWADNPAGANLYNKEGLPASPFTTDRGTSGNTFQ